MFARFFLLLLSHHAVFDGLVEAIDSSNGEQYFIDTPKFINTVVAGGQILLKCKVGNLAGKVQWTRNGFALGYQPDLIKNYCGQCSLAGDAQQGEYHLLVQNIRQNTVYECQASPDRRNSHRGLRAVAKIKVLVPPSSLEMNPQVSVDMKAGNPQKLSCTAKGSSPKAKIVWYHRGMKILDQEYEERVTAGMVEGTWNTENIIIFNATSRDNDTRLSCVVEHEAIKKLAMRRDIRLNVFYPPGEPEILGDIVGAWRVGDHINITCHISSGNPPPEVSWFKNNKQIKGVDWTRISNGSTVSVLIGKVAIEDITNTYTCKAWNSKSSALVVSQPIKLNVTYGPINVKISGPQRAHSGSRLQFSCRSDKSNPPATIKWSVNGEHRNGLQTNVEAVSGAWRTESKIEILVDISSSKLAIECAAIHPTLGQTATNTHRVLVIRPPVAPQINGLPADRVLKEGDSVSLTCISHHGHPFPQLIWYKQGNKLEHQTFKMVKDSHSEAVLEIKVDRTDNQMEYRCQATNEANFVPANRNITLQVLFPPKEVSIYMTPHGGGPKMSIIRAGDFADLHCDVSISNPEPRVRWFREGKLLTQKPVIRRKLGQTRGHMITSTLPINGGGPVMSEDDRHIFSCVVDNPMINHYNITKQLTLSVRYKPKFNDSVLERYSVIEGKSKTVKLHAIANPSNIEYQWYNVSQPVYNSGEPRITFFESSMSVMKANRRDTGLYVIGAKNSIGETRKQIYLDVFYPPTIVELTDQVQRNEGDSVTFVCRIDANPITNNTVTWGRVQQEQFDFSRAEFSHDGRGRFTMTIQSIRKSDRGKFFCSADNQLGEAEMKTETGLLVNFKPEIRKFPRYAKFSADLRQQVNLKCVAYGFPDVRMYWVRNGTMNPERYRAGGIPKQLDYATWESTLTIESTQAGDFTQYKCIAKNDLGEDSHIIGLVHPGLPDPPHNLVVTRQDYKTIRLQWSPGFDGGFPQQFITKVRELYTGAIVMEEILEHSKMEPYAEYVSQYIVGGLRPGVKYGFSVRAVSEKGKSKYSTEKLKSLEVLVMNARSKDESSDVMIVGIGITFLVLFLILTLIITLICKKQKNIRQEKHKKRERSQSVSTSSRRSIFIERYPPSKPYTNALGGDMFISTNIYTDAGEPDYKHYLGRSMSAPHDSGFPSYAGSCDIPSVITPLNRQVSSGIGIDTTLDDDVFDDGSGHSVSKEGEEPKCNSPPFTADMMLKGGRGRTGSVTSPYAYFSPPRLGVSVLPSQMSRSYRNYSTSSSHPDNQTPRGTSATLGRIHSSKYISMVTPENKKTSSEIVEELDKRMSELTNQRNVEPSNSMAHLQLPMLPELPKPAVYPSDLPKLPGYSSDLPDLPAFSSDLPKLPGYSSERKGQRSEMTGYQPELSLPGYAPNNRKMIV